MKTNSVKPFRQTSLLARMGAWAVFLPSCLLASGCGDGAPPAWDVSGTVTFNGKPVPAGRIYFNPDFSKGNDGPQGYADIRDGAFDTRKGGKGGCGGPTIAVIEGFDGGDGVDPKFLGNRLFLEFQVPIELAKAHSTKDFEVPASAAQNLPKGPRPTKRP